MTELANPQPLLQEAAEAPEQILTPNAILGRLEEKGIQIDNREAVGQSLQTLRQEFGIRDAAFDDFKRTAVLTAAAERLIEVDESTSSVGSDTSEKEYIADVVMGIAGDYTDFDMDRQYDSGKFELSSEHKKKVYEKYKQPELSSELDDFIHSPKFDHLRERLGVVDEDPFEVIVLSIDPNTGYGLVTGPDFDSTDTAVETWRKGQEYKAALKERTEKFAEELGGVSVGQAWVKTFEDGTKALCVGSTLAEKVLYPDDPVRVEGYSANDYEDDLAVIEHEYVHTQGVITDGKVGLGIGLEELRAEHFSGNKQGYTDIKRFFNGLDMVTGHNPARSFEVDGGPYDQDEFFADIARHNGLSGLLDAMVAIPTAYVQEDSASEYIKAIVSHNGGLDGQFQGIYDREVKKYGQAVVDKKVSEYVDKLYAAVKDNRYITVESWFSNGGIRSLRDIAIENFRSRYPDASDGYDYAA